MIARFKKWLTEEPELSPEVLEQVKKIRERRQRNREDAAKWRQTREVIVDGAMEDVLSLEEEGVSVNDE